jgi:hypothetical protein
MGPEGTVQAVLQGSAWKLSTMLRLVKIMLSVRIGVETAWSIMGRPATTGTTSMETVAPRLALSKLDTTALLVEDPQHACLSVEMGSSTPPSPAMTTTLFRETAARALAKSRAVSTARLPELLEGPARPSVETLWSWERRPAMMETQSTATVAPRSVLSRTDSSVQEDPAASPVPSTVSSAPTTLFVRTATILLCGMGKPVPLIARPFLTAAHAPSQAFPSHATPARSVTRLMTSIAFLYAGMA